MRSFLFILFIVFFAEGFSYTADKNNFGSIVWRFKVPNYDRETRYSGVGTARYYNNRIYFTCNYGSRLYCLDAQTGKKLWDFNYFVSAEQNCKDSGVKLDPNHRAFWMVPILSANDVYPADGRIFMGARDGMDDVVFSCLFCIEASTGRKLWRLPFSGSQARYIYDVNGGRVYFDNGCADEKTGKLLWYAGKLYSNRIGASAFALASDDGQGLLYATDGGVSPLYVVRQTGGGISFLKVGTNLGFQALRISGKGKLFLNGPGDYNNRTVNCVDIATGNRVWEYRFPPGDNLPPSYGTPVEDQGWIILAYDRVNDHGLPEYHIAAVGSDNGNELWNTIVAEHPAQMGWVTVYQGRVYYIEAPFNLACLDGSSGKKLWSISIGPSGKDTLSMFWAPAIHDGRAYVVDKVVSTRSYKVIRSDIVCIDIGQ
jgi:outer membrane protein assembly factor BamB